MKTEGLAARPRVVIVGQLPPPVHGQSLAIERLVRAEFSRVVIHHVPMDFSDSISDVGRFRMRKLVKLARLIWRVLRVRFATGATILYYPPAGPNLVPVLRDLVFLTVVRPFFPALVLELHAGGLERIEDRLIAPVRGLFRHAYHGATLLIEKYPSDPGAQRIPARRRLVVSNGVDDEFPRFTDIPRRTSGLTILYVGMVTPLKGMWTLLEALATLIDRGVDARAVVVGAFSADRIADEWSEALRRRGLAEHVQTTGPMVGDAKWRAFHGADIFCFPSRYDETCPLAIIEAMQFRLPVVASDRAGIPYLVREGETGFLAPVGDATAVADRLEQLAKDPQLREAMGARARQVYLERYTGQAYLDAMEDALLSVATAAGE